MEINIDKMFWKMPIESGLVVIRGFNQYVELFFNK